MERDRIGASGAALGRAAWGPAAALRERVGTRRASALALAWRATWTSRLLVWAAGAGALLAYGTAPGAAAFDPDRLTQPFGARALDLLAGPAARWDSVWFLTIADHGYAQPARTAFFPLYPLLLRAGGAVLGSPLVAGVLVSGACLVVALAALHELTELELGPAAARWTVIALALSPMAFFLSAVYSESLFLALSVGCVLCARRGRWWWAGVLGALAAATRSTGVLVLVALALLALRERGRPRLGRLAPLVLVPAGLGAFLAALAAAGHDPLAPFHAQHVWLRHWAGPFGAVPDGVAAVLRDPLSSGGRDLMLLGFLMLGAPALLGAARRLPAAYAAYALAALAVPLSEPAAPQPLMSLPRFELVLFPLWMWWGAWLAEHRRARAPALALGAAGLAVFSALFSTWHWVA